MRRVCSMFVVQLACAALFYALYAHIDTVLGPAYREFANDAAQLQRHLDRLERHSPGAVARVIAASEGTR